MDVLFEQEARLSEDVIREEIAWRTWHSPAAVQKYMVTLLCLGMVLLFQLWLRPWSASFILVSLLLVCSGWVFRVIMYFREVRDAIEAAKDVNHGELYILKRTVTEENICSQSSIGAKKVLGYDQFVCAVSLKSCILLISKNDGPFRIAREGFTKGSPEALIAFLRAKGVKVK